MHLILQYDALHVEQVQLQPQRSRGHPLLQFTITFLPSKNARVSRFTYDLSGFLENLVLVFKLRAGFFGHGTYVIVEEAKWEQKGVRDVYRRKPRMEFRISTKEYELGLAKL